MDKNIVRPFDFSRIKKLSAKQVAITEAILSYYPQFSDPEEFAILVLAQFGYVLGLEFKLKFVDFAEMTQAQFVELFPSPCISAQFLVEPMEGKITLELDYNLGCRLIRTLLGATEFSEEIPHPLSPIEEGILEFLFVKLLGHIQDTPGPLGPSTFRLLKTASEAKIVLDPANGTQPGCILKFYLQVGEGGGYIRIYMPHPLLEGVLLREDILASLDAGEDMAQYEEKLERVSHIQTNVIAEIGTVSLMSSEAAQLEKEDVILFDDTMAQMGSHGLTGKAVIKSESNSSEGLLAEIVDAEGKLVLKILDFYGGA